MTRPLCADESSAEMRADVMYWFGRGGYKFGGAQQSPPLLRLPSFLMRLRLCALNPVFVLLLSQYLMAQI